MSPLHRPPPGFLTARRVSPWPSQPPQPHSASQFTALSLRMFHIKWLPSLISSSFSMLCPQLFLVWVCPQLPLPVSRICPDSLTTGSAPAEVGITMTGWRRPCSSSSPALLRSSVSHLTLRKFPKSDVCPVWLCGPSPSEVAGVGLALRLVLVLHTFYPWNCDFSRANQFGEVLLILRFSL